MSRAGGTTLRCKFAPRRVALAPTPDVPEVLFDDLIDHRPIRFAATGAAMLVHVAAAVYLSEAQAHGIALQNWRIQLGEVHPLAIVAEQGALPMPNDPPWPSVEAVAVTHCVEILDPRNSDQSWHLRVRGVRLIAIVHRRRSRMGGRH
eukprot:CAMPEP_0180571584 /NCGR_PEP_ID=MMETSP1037_2-20121125/8796_1 /TAXON_ID=632150 /ORGANISM="Azadinium spinosum, Strain 3D9" /LENGTH=147 /DNA_ID=CAMNT_0022588909 /DNA_START=242 /DNA_END=687 /DNA_ORIENTATION=+